MTSSVFAQAPETSGHGINYWTACTYDSLFLAWLTHYAFNDIREAKK